MVLKLGNFGCVAVEIIGFGLFCGFVMLKYMGGFAVVQGGKVSAHNVCWSFCG